MQDPGFVRRAFSDIADRYVITNHVLSLGIDVLWRRKLGRMIQEQAPTSLLDVGTGSGDVAAEAKRRFPNIFLVGIDFCAPMLVHARKRGITHLAVADGMRMPFENNTFEAITIAFGLRNMASWPEALKEMARVLKPSGTLYILDFSQPTWPLLRGPYLFYLHHILPKIAGVITGKREAFEYLSSSIDRFPCGREMIDLIESSGFESGTHRSLSGGIAAIYSATASASA